MGRYYSSKKTEADGCIKIQIWWLKKNGYLEPSLWHSGGIQWENGFSEKTSSVSIEVSLSGENIYLRVYYTQTDRFTGEKKDFDYKIPLTSTPCFFGGKRYWFVCPWYANGKYCGRRVGVLYRGGDYFACRHCYNLTYSSRNLGGIAKVAGQVVSMPELEQLKEEVKRKYYAGKMTRRYRRYIKKQEKSLFQLKVMAFGLGR